MKALVNFLITLSGKNVFLPFYHCVADETPTHLKHLYRAKPVDEFRKELIEFKRFFRPIGLHELIQHRGKRFKEPVFHLTFDDGFREFYEIAPILEEMNIPATVFVNNYFVDNQDLMYRCKQSVLFEEVFKKLTLKGKSLEIEQWRKKVFEIEYKNRSHLDTLANDWGYSFQDYLANEKPYLTSNQIQDLMARGFTIGAHTTNHPLLGNLPNSEILPQVESSLALLKNQFKVNYSAFSFPFSERKISHAVMTQFGHKVDISFGSLHLLDTGFDWHFSRVGMEAFKGNPWYCLNKLFLKSIAKNVIGKSKIDWECD